MRLILWLYRLIPFHCGWRKGISCRQKPHLAFAWNLARNSCCIASRQTSEHEFRTSFPSHHNLLNISFMAALFCLCTMCDTHILILGLFCAFLLALGSSYFLRCTMPCTNSIHSAEGGASFDAASISPPSLFRWFIFFRRKMMRKMIKKWQWHNLHPLAPCQGILGWSPPRPYHWCSIYPTHPLYYYNIWHKLQPLYTA